MTNLQELWEYDLAVFSVITHVKHKLQKQIKLSPFPQFKSIKRIPGHAFLLLLAYSDNEQRLT